MSSNQSIVSQCVSVLNKDLGLEPEAQLPAVQQSDPLEALENNLTRVIDYLLEKDFSRLLNAMYRIDIPEEDFKMILETSAPDSVSRNLSKRIIKRAIQKVELREKYKNK